MSNSLPPVVRLADASSVGAELYNYFQLATMVSSLYVKASERRGEEDWKGAWSISCDAAINQMGLIHECWDKAGYDKSPKSSDTNASPLLLRSMTLVNRLLILERFLNEWTPIERWAIVLSKIEAQVNTFAHRLAKTETVLAEQVDKMGQLTMVRRRMLNEIAKKSVTTKQRIQKAYAVPVSLG
ncbi:MAG: hypothetical protein NT027_04175 [Proteobacteria bacterium]|nr:hypothetical protein [Pseudomonadota bacterium]